MSSKIIILLNSILILLPTIVFAEDDSYNTLAGFSNTLLNVLSWFGYAVAMRNTNMDRYKIHDEQCK